MKAIKRIEAFAMALLMLVSTVVFACSDIQKVSAASTFTIRLHYVREDGNYSGWNVWSWTPNADGKQYDFTEEDGGKSVVTSIEVAVGTAQVGYIVRKGEWDAKDYDGDQWIPTADYTGGTVDYYVKSTIAGGEVKDDNVTKGCVIANVAADKTDYSKINVEFNMDPSTVSPAIDVKSAIKVKDSDNKDVDIKSIVVDENDAKKVTVTLNSAIDIEEACMNSLSYNIVFNDINYTIALPDFYSSDDFESKYTYTGNDLGATWTKDSTTFKVWAPTASELFVNLYKSGTAGTDDLIASVPMTKGEKGVWSVVQSGDLNKTYYTYTVKFSNGKVNEDVCDPYAKTVGVNGNRAMVIDMVSTDPSGWATDKNPQSGMKSYADASIWEVHVRDFSYQEDSGVKTEYRGKYLAFTQTGTVNKSGQSTCLDYLKQLGVTHVQINPAYDYATVDESSNADQFNWGYDPKNYNAPEGSYSTDPYNGEVRVNEYKQMVQSLHNAGIGVIMDVVYNHTYNTEYCMNQLVPGYLYRGTNGSGCGNDVASERSMARKLIVDSVLYWNKEYHIDGFRFDISGLLDVDTINEIAAELHKIDPSIILYGEGWTISTGVVKDNVNLANQGNSDLTPEFAYFNDGIRDVLKGNVFNDLEPGYISGAISKDMDVFNCAKAAPAWTGMSSKPLQCINYSSCHDNYTLWDKINIVGTKDTFDEKVKSNNLAAAITFTSQGIPFTIAGEEILRTKIKGKDADGNTIYDHNSYASSSKENCIKWDTLNIEKYQNVLKYYQGLIAFRNAHSSLRMSNGEDAEKCINKIDTSYLNKISVAENTMTQGGVVEYSITGYQNEDDIVVIFNPNKNDLNVKLPEGLWNSYIEGNKAGNTVLNSYSGSVNVEGVTATVLVKAQQTDLSKSASVSGIKTKTYTGKSITQSLKVTYNKTTLKNGTDYKVTYSNNKNAGTAKVAIKFCGKYKGTITKTFKIAKAAQSISAKSKISVKAKSKAFKLGAKLSKGNGKLTYKSSNTKIAKINSKGVVTLTGKKGKVKITVTAAATTNFNKAAKTITITSK